jgi:maltooligosyltrehalose synthase
VSADPFAVNKEVLAQVQGVYGVLDVINSGSAMELDEQTVKMIKNVVKEKKIHTLWFEAHYMYKNQLAKFAEQFEGVQVKFRCGVESFDGKLREYWNKGIAASVTAEDVANYFQGVCLLCCTEGDSQERILRDIALAEQYFEYASVNVFCENTTAVKRDDELAKWFVKHIYPKLKQSDKIEILINNTDLGVG